MEQRFLIIFFIIIMIILIVGGGGGVGVGGSTLQYKKMKKGTVFDFILRFSFIDWGRRHCFINRKESSLYIFTFFLKKI